MEEVCRAQPGAGGQVGGWVVGAGEMGRGGEGQRVMGWGQEGSGSGGQLGGALGRLGGGMG